MYSSFLYSLTLLASAAVGALAADLKIEVTLAVECERKTHSGDNIDVHYRGTLASNGNQFDSSYDRGKPLTFQLGAGRVIKGWDGGLVDMCIGEKRTLTIPPELGYGNRAMGPIPAGSTLIFETELMGIAGVPKPESIVTKPTASSEETATETETASVTEMAEASATVVADADKARAHTEL
ncbi:hypothetical protein GGS21DRAFT_434011 [Xylaria nigripes]|nr:hypothetical protein GGS21DRAFT_434011 [Xylaria nigripes]